MTEAGIIQLVKEIIGPVSTMLTVVAVALIQRRASKRRDKKLDDIKNDVNGNHTEALTTISTLKDEVVRLQQPGTTTPYGIPDASTPVTLSAGIPTTVERASMRNVEDSTP